MNHYAKLATVAFRVVAIILLGYALLGSLFLAFFAAGTGIGAFLVPAIGGLLLAIVLFLAAPILGRVAALGMAPVADVPENPWS